MQLLGSGIDRSAGFLGLAFLSEEKVAMGDISILD
jgi:hypothetical protein